MDGIRAVVVKRMFTRIRLLFLIPSMRCFARVFFRRSEKMGKLKVFLKSPDKDPQLLKSYTPVTLLPVLGKIAERIIADRLGAFLDGIQFFSESQF